MANNNTLMKETLAQFYGVLLYKKKNIVAIQERQAERKLSILPLVTIGGNANKLVVPLDSELMGKTLADFEILNLLMYLEEDIIEIQDELDIIGYSNQARAEEVNENVRAQLRKFKEFHSPLEDDPDVILLKYGEMGVKKIMFTGEGLPLFPKVSPQQLHEIFVKNPANTDQCPCLEQVS
ncbi:hypothetical protein GLOIN_2v1489205 [Rhizophagus clarus]|uniref:Uncharacterized protein n=1 Tax=Rhizophagus clarus TaxID=94130 RepID=A0A8H3L7C3_9GLOM|nr:hypothetical protein GLOIN_2v1489205 [Rhizophagus clarus]